MAGWLGYSVRRKLLDEDLEAVKTRIRGSVLEVGCGTIGRRGRFRPPFEQTKDWTYVDLRGSAEPTIQADIEHLPIRDTHFDTVICLEVLEYVPHPGAALSELRRVLKPGGTLIVSTPFLHRADALQDRWRFTEHGLHLVLNQIGFRVDDTNRQGAALAVVVNILKFAVSSVPKTLWRKALGALAYLPLTALLGMDGLSSKLLPVLGTFSTGYLLVAVKVERQTTPDFQEPFVPAIRHSVKV